MRAFVCAAVIAAFAVLRIVQVQPLVHRNNRFPNRQPGSPNRRRVVPCTAADIPVFIRGWFQSNYDKEQMFFKKGQQKCITKVARYSSEDVVLPEAKLLQRAVTLVEEGFSEDDGMIASLDSEGARIARELAAHKLAEVTTTACLFGPKCDDILHQLAAQAHCTGETE